MKRRRRIDQHSCDLNPREQADREASGRRHIMKTTAEISAALKSSTEQNGEHNRIRASGKDEGGRCGD